MSKQNTEFSMCYFKDGEKKELKGCVEKCAQEKEFFHTLLDEFLENYRSGESLEVHFVLSPCNEHETEKSN